MRGRDIIGIVLVTFLCLWGTLYLETGMQEFFVLELFIILLMIIVSAGIFYGAALEKKWAWKSAFAFFIFAALNCTFVYLFTGNLVPYAVAFLSSVAGIGASAINSGMDFSAGSVKAPKKNYPKHQPVQSHKTRMLDAIKRYHQENPYYENEVMPEEEKAWDERAEETEIPGVQVELETYREEPPIYRHAPKPNPPAINPSFAAPKPKAKKKPKAKSKPSKSKAGKASKPKKRTKSGKTSGKKKTTKAKKETKKAKSKKKR